MLILLNMLHHRSLYDSIEAQEATSLVENDVEAPRAPRFLLTRRTGVACLSCVGILALFIANPSLTFDLPLIGESIQKAHAQNIADDFRLSFLSATRTRELEKEKRPEFKAPDGCEATVVIVRHCEKGSIREHCSYVGYERSVYLSTIFGNDDERWPAPTFIFALDAGKRHDPKKRVYREMETVLPLAVKSSVTVDYSYDTNKTPLLARRVSDLLRSGEACGKVIVICWKHSEIPHLAHKLGCGPGQGCPADYPSYSFDQAWQIKVRLFSAAIVRFIRDDRVLIPLLQFVYHKLHHSERKNGRIPKHDVWNVYGNVEDEGFDPLAFSKRMGDYPHGGKASGGASWMPLDVEVPEQGLPREKTHK